MKVVKVTIRLGDLGEPRMKYPKRYNAEEVDRGGIGPLNVNQSGAYSGGIGRGGDSEECIIVLKDALAEEYARDPDMEIITEAQADALMEQWRIDNGETEEVVQDAMRIQAIAAKQAAGIPLSAEDLKALDPEDDVPGINKRLKPLSKILAKVPQAVVEK